MKAEIIHEFVVLFINKKNNKKTTLKFQSKKNNGCFFALKNVRDSRVKSVINSQKECYEKNERVYTRF